MIHPAAALAPDAITVGEALEAAGLSAGNKPIDESDAAAIQAAETRATGLGHVVPGGVGAKAQSAAAHNIRTTRDELKTKLGDVLKVNTSPALFSSNIISDLYIRVYLNCFCSCLVTLC